MSEVSRRDLFRALLGRPRRPADMQPAAPPTPPAGSPQVALILDRFCLAYQGSFCSVCVEQCPEAGAILVTMGRPQVVAVNCTGCRKCQDVCPAPRNAVFLVDSQPRPGMIPDSRSPDPPPTGHG